MSNLVQKYLKRISARKAESTLRNRKVSIRQFFEWHTGEDIEDIEEYEPDTIFIEQVDIEDYIDHLLDEEYAHKSIQNKVYGISDFCNYAERRGADIDLDISETEIDGITGNEIDNHTKKRYIEKDDFEDMMKSTDKLRNKILLLLMWDTGVRSQEAISIKIDDIDREERSIEVENAKGRELSGDEERTVYYGKKFDLLLTKWLDRGGRDSYMYTDTPEDEGHLLVTKQQPYMAIGRVNEIVKEAIERVGIQEELYEDKNGRTRLKYTSHALRHSFAVHRVKNGCPLVYLQSMMGHSDIEQTREYLQFRGDDVKEAYRKYSP